MMNTNTFKRIRSILRFFVIILLITATSALIATNIRNNATASTLASGFEAGNIIDDAVFTNYTSMSAAQIQSFLEAKTPTCYPNGVQPIPKWVYDYGNSAPFTCMRNYTQDGKKASQIIYEIAQKYRINPQVLLVLLQKEQSLITDTWPVYNPQYKTATGYACPDTAPCDSKYFGLTNQLDWAAKMFRAIMDNVPQSQWYTPYILGNNYIQYNPSASCGGSVVNIKNRATQALYNYTPYQPNQDSLNAGWGSVTCGSYGNRNFYQYFTQWFGSTKAQPNYTWSVESQQVSVDGQISNSSASTLTPGQTAKLIIRAKNTGNQTWNTFSARIATSRPNDRVSAVEDTTWLSPDRPAQLREQVVSPGDVGTFEFKIKAPNVTGDYREYFNIVLEGQAWLKDIGLYYDITVKNPSTPFYNAQILERKLFTDSNMKNEVPITGANIVKNNGKLYGRVKFKNTGNQTFYDSFTYLATTTDRDRASLFYDPSWPSADRASRLQEASVAPQGTGTFLFTLSAPDNVASYTENFGVVAEGKGWADNDRATFKINVVEPTRDRLAVNSSLNAGMHLQSSNAKYTFTAQTDGNLVLYSGGRAIWSSNTAGKPLSYLDLQGDGNLVAYGGGRAIWSSNTAGKPSVGNLVMQDDGNLVIYGNGRAIWSSNTAGR